ncbi:MAG: [FeFe] hydrogenase H-cluster radical SAM maturase HydE [Spirochaetales bacterium]|jgi:biotin synthase|nr:[FeFe] hydrogenase H-cluster radical SAM maturase HydE [Spirochaetales bacterium]
MHSDVSSRGDEKNRGAGEKLTGKKLTDAQLLHLITTEDPGEMRELFAAAGRVREVHYGKAVYFRGLIEFTSFCKNNCYYCGLRKGNAKIERYRLSPEEILACCRMGDTLGYKTFVLQGGEDPFFDDEKITGIVSAIKKEFPESALTLSLGERPRESYERFFRAGADRYLLRHETADPAHYGKMHPPEMSLAERKNCLRELKKIGFQVGAGFMTGSPFQTPGCLLQDLRFMEELQPEMIGIGPFIPQADTPFGSQSAGSLNLALRMVALARLAVPAALIPATTAMGTIAPDGRELALKAGANVVMPNLSPQNVRKLYALYDNKICTGDEAAACRFCIEGRIRSAGFEPLMCRGDWAGFTGRKTPPGNTLKK